VVAQEGAALSLAEVTQYLDALGVAKFKWPERLECIDEMPLGPGGKIKKDTLREWLKQTRQPHSQ